MEVGTKYEKRGISDDGNGLFECDKYAVSCLLSLWAEFVLIMFA